MPELSLRKALAFSFLAKVTLEVASNSLHLLTQARVLLVPVLGTPQKSGATAMLAQ